VLVRVYQKRWSEPWPSPPQEQEHDGPRDEVQRRPQRVSSLMVTFMPLATAREPQGQEIQPALTSAQVPVAACPRPHLPMTRSVRAAVAVCVVFMGGTLQRHAVNHKGNGQAGPGQLRPRPVVATLVATCANEWPPVWRAIRCLTWGNVLRPRQDSNLRPRD